MHTRRPAPTGSLALAFSRRLVRALDPTIEPVERVVSRAVARVQHGPFGHVVMWDGCDDPVWIPCGDRWLTTARALTEIHGPVRVHQVDPDGTIGLMVSPWPPNVVATAA